MNIRPYTPQDFEMIKSWHKEAPEQGQLPLDSSFILENNGIPTVCVSVILTNASICYMDNMVGNPEVKDRKDATKAIIEYAWQFAKNKGYKYSVAFTKHNKLAERHIQMGWQKLSSGFILGRVN